MLNSYQHINHMLVKLFEAEHRRLQKNIDRLHEANQEASRVRLDGFMYQGKAYRPASMIGVPGAAGKRTLHLSLWPDMDKHLADEKKISLDHASIHQVLFKLIEPCHCLQHVRDAIPDCIVDTAPDEIRALDRMGGPDFKTVRDLRQYNKALPLMEFYSAARLLY